MKDDQNITFEYLEAAGITAICLFPDQAPHIRVGRQLLKVCSADMIYWLDASIAAGVARQARLAIGDKPTVESMRRALLSAAASRKSGLTPHLVVMSRANFLAKKLRAKIEHLRITGQLREFNAEYRRRRTEAEAKGKGFMPYSNAMLRLRRALIAVLVKKQEVAQMQSLFMEIFNDNKNEEADRYFQ